MDFRFSERTKWNLGENRLSKLLEQELSRGAEIFDLTESNPTRVGLIFPEVAEIIARHLKDSLIYEPNAKGLLAARQAVSEYYNEHGASVETERVYLTASTSEAYTHLFRLVTIPGDRVLVPKPSYPLFDYLAQLCDVTADRYPLAYDRVWRIDRDAFATAFTKTTRAVIVVRPNNPTGSYFSDDDLKYVDRQCAERGIALICDEVFLDYSLKDGPPKPSALSVCDQSLTFALSGISKFLALPQLKLGWIAVAGPPELRNPAMERLEVIADTFLSVNTPVQQALPELMKHRGKIQEQILRRIRTNWEAAHAAFDGPPNVSILPPEGGWCAVVRLPNLRTDEEWALELLKSAGVLVHPGYFYDFEEEGNIVISLLPEPAVLSRALEKITAQL
ncbi:MAG: pyridoxal phosphate-dependent aminotransferase [bacterium]